MKKLTLIIFIFAIVSCSSGDGSDDQTPNSQIQIESISSLKGGIGDLIEIEGKNLDELTFVKFVHDDEKYTNENILITEFESQSNTKISFFVPILVHEDITLFLGQIESYEFELIGFIPTLFQTEYDFPEIVILNESLAFLRDRSKIYKSNNGFYDWVAIEVPNSNVSEMFFISEMEGWVSTNGGGGTSELFYTSNGGASYSSLFTTPHSAGNIESISYNSDGVGLLTTQMGIVYVTTDNVNFVDVYDHYNDLNSLPFQKLKIIEASINENGTLFISPQSEPILIRIGNDSNVSYTSFNEFTSGPPNFGNDGSVGFLSVFFHTQFYKTSDDGLTWGPVGSSVRDEFPLLGATINFNFFSSDKGFLLDSRFTASKSRILETSNGGVSWELYAYWPTSRGFTGSSFLGAKGIIVDDLERVWKYLGDD